MLKRTLAAYTRSLAARYPVVTITGPRQSGKTTLARSVFRDKAYVNLEKPDVREYAAADPNGFLAQYPYGAVLDEIQRVPSLVSYLQPIVDDRKENGMYVLTGSQQFEMMHAVSQSLAGRTAVLKLLPFSIEELRSEERSIDEYLFSGFYPFIHDRGIPPAQALSDYFQTYIERDMRQMMHVRDLSLFQKFIRLCAGRVGQLLNLNSLADDTGISHTTAREWMSILEAGYVVFLLEPYSAHIKKRLVKSPKLYFYDVGLAVHLCGIEHAKQIATYPLRGSFFENLVVMEVLKYRYHRGRLNNLFFYRDSNGNEVDLLYAMADEMVPIEIKASQTVSPDHGKGFLSLEKIKMKMPHGKLLVYGGKGRQSRKDMTIIPPQDIASVLNTIERPLRMKAK